ncbi:MAG: 3-dehydroquinate synthase family protein [Sphaerochaetaceae bacterium]|jgi:3-dehydroquinate synthase
METLLKSTLACGRTSTVMVSSGLKDLASYLSGYGRNVMWVFDTNTSNLFRQLPTNSIVLENGEEHKDLKSLLRILSSASDYGMARDSRFIGFGGGVVCDLTALAASLYMRGCGLALVPTTLLCMSDACLGGKTAIDWDGNKNLIGTFKPADEILICADTLRTLADNEYLNGLGEVIKHAFLSPDDELYRFLTDHRMEILRRETAVLDRLVLLSLAVKNWYLEQDPTETKGIRSLLNLGHTFGHALESLGHFSGMSHGQCVAWGTCRAAEAADEMHIGEEKFETNIIKMFRDYGFPVDFRIGRGDWIEYAAHISHDKKKIGGSVQFVIPLSQGKAKLMPLDTSLVQKLVIAKPY